MTRIRLALATICLFGIACASTSITSMVAPEAGGKVFRRILVVAELQDLGMMQQVERTMEAEAAARIEAGRGTLICDPTCRAPGGLAPGTAFIPAHTILFPGRAYSQSELQSILTEHQVDATLVMSPTSAGVSETYVPPTYVTSCTTWSSTTSCSSSPVGGGTLKSPWVSFSARLYDARSGAVVWIATSNTNGSPLSGSSSLISSMAKKALANLLSDKVIM